MKKTTLFMLFFAFAMHVFSQETSFPMSYSLHLNKAKDKRDNSNNLELTIYDEAFTDENGKRINYTVTHTKFYPDKMSQIFEYFIKHVDKNKSAKNYFNDIYYSGLGALTKSSLTAFTDPKLFAISGNYHFDLEGDTLIWKDGFARGKSWYGNIMANYEGNFTCDTVQTEFPYPPYDSHDTVLCTASNGENTDGLGFTEIWNFSGKTGAFTKKIEFLSLRNYKFSTNDEYIGVYPILNFKTNSKSDKKNQFQNDMKYDVFFDSWNACNPYVDCNGCDLLVGESSYGSSTRNNIQVEARNKLFVDIFNAIASGSLIALEDDGYGNPTEKKLSMDDVYVSLTSLETVQIVQPYEPYDMKDTTITLLKESSSIIGIRFVEDWSFEPLKFNFYKKVKQFALLFEVFDVYGNLIGYKPYFHLKQKD